ncbi:serine/threonine-protein kinase atr, partial [Hyalella azteca]|uniref:Serine/threonine-protein kinase atr n=1 Tax=Hyalella azteca TaxID=294128 RepID=A0A8B7NF53_HYAAZ
GETFDWPERVPFRLTHNMTEAMGHGALYGLFLSACQVHMTEAMGHGALYGLFLSACQHTMRIMRAEREALLSVVRPFIHDPLVEWSKGDKAAKNTGEINNEKVLFKLIMRKFIS